MDLTISIVNWNVKEYLKKCLDSILKYSQGFKIEIIVVDNASSDGSVEMLKREFPNVMVIENKENEGYGNAHNRAIKIARGRYILFLNPDVELLADTLEKTMEFMDNHPDAGACLCDEVSRLGYDYILLSKLNIFLLTFLQRLNKLFYSRFVSNLIADFLIKQLLLARQVKEPDGLEGGFVLVRQKAVKQVNGFDPKFFLGSEGWDLTNRIQKLNWKLYFLPGVRIIHYWGKSLNQISTAELVALQENWRKRMSQT